MTIQRRGFLAAMFAAAAAPAIVRADSLMRVFVPKTGIVTLWGDGIHDDASALQYWLDGGRVYSPTGVLQSSVLSGASLLISKTLVLHSAQPGGKTITGCNFRSISNFSDTHSMFEAQYTPKKLWIG